jgi:hypothetical protein
MEGGVHMVDPAAVLEQVGYVIAGFVAISGIGAVTFLCSLCFPSFRAVIVERMRQRTLRHADATDLGAQIAALRGEVYALRSELAQRPNGLSPEGAHSGLARLRPPA